MKTHLRPLVEKQLLYGGLVTIGPALIERYNHSLESMGIAPTDRRTIQIDGVGWSPEVARDQRNPFYLCAGGIINPIAVIVTPEQYKKPVYMPVFSWMRRLMRQFFDKYHREIIDVTSTHAISLDFEDWMSTLVGPHDLMLLSEVEVVPHAGSLFADVTHQKALVADFMKGLNCLDTKIRTELLKHREQHGDLRRRRVGIERMQFDLVKDFYTTAFGGAAVIRGVGDKDLLILEHAEEVASFGKFKDQAYHDLNNFALYELNEKTHAPFVLLQEAGMLEVPEARFRENPELLEEKKNVLLALALCDCEEGLEWETLTPAKRKSLMNRHTGLVPETFEELERYAAALRRGKSTLDISFDLWHYLLEPSPNLPPSTQDVLWILLTRKDPRNILELYTHDKNFFLAQYESWSRGKQSWAANYLAARYEPRMSQP